MYDELVKRMRKCATEACACRTCELDSNPSCTDVLMEQAADAIEELSHDYEKLAENFNSAVELLHKREKPRWISTEELLPKDLQNVLVIDEGSVTIGHCEHYYGEKQIFVEWHDTLYYPIDPPYWMPLPPAPGNSLEKNENLRKTPLKKLTKEE